MLYTSSCQANQVQDFFEVVNHGAPVTLSDITIQFWADDTSGVSLTGQVYYGGCLMNPSCFHAVSGVSLSAAKASTACGDDPSHPANWQMTLSTTDPAVLGGGVSWVGIQTSVHRTDYQNFIPGTGSWYSGCVGGNTYVNDLHYALYVQGNLVTASTGVPPACLAPHGSQELKGEIPPASAGATLVGSLPATAVVNLAITLPLQNPAGLETFLQQVSNPSSPQFRHYLSVDQFAAQYGPAPADYQTLQGFAASNGLTVISTYKGRYLLGVRGTAAQVESAFFVTLNVYQRPDGSTYYAPANQPSANLALPLLHVGGLDNYARPQFNATIKGPVGGAQPNGGSFTDGTCPNYGTMNPYIGKDFRTAYGVPAALDGTGQSVALLECDSYFQNDIASYAGLIKQATPVATNIVVPPGTAAFTPIEQDGANEAVLDIDMVMSMAPKARIYVYEINPDLFIPEYILGQIADDDLAPVISCSITWPPPETDLPQFFEQFVAQGQSFFQAAGDYGAYVAGAPTPDVPDPMIDTPYMTVVGGTQLTTGGGASYTLETAWNNSQEKNLPPLPGKGAGGGGICTAYGSIASLPLPSWQSGLSPAGATASARYIPDVSMVADNLITYDTNVTSPFAQNLWCSYGTSAAAPLWAALMALANEQNHNNGLPNVGFANPILYSLASTDFNDIQDGSTNNYNTSGVVTQPYQAEKGYDLVTGLGSPKAANLINDLEGKTSCPNGSTWQLETTTNVFTPRSGFESLVYNPQDGNGPRMWVIGGNAAAGGTGPGEVTTPVVTAETNDVWSTLDGITWNQTASTGLPNEAFGTAVVFDPGDGNGPRMWLLGGQTSSGTPTSTVYYSYNGATWNPIQSGSAVPVSPFTPRSGHTTVVFTDPLDGKSKMWVIAGNGATGELNDVWKSPDGNNWTQALADNPTPPSTQFSVRAGHSSMVFDPGDGQGPRMWVMAGGTAQVPNGVWYSFNGTAWTEATASPAWGNRAGQAGFAFCGKMWLIGGSNGLEPQQTNSQVWSSVDGINWTEVTAQAPFNSRTNLGALPFQNGLFVFGGACDLSSVDCSPHLNQAGETVYPSTPFNDVWVSPTP
jgi:hypothetical protein